MKSLDDKLSEMTFDDIKDFCDRESKKEYPLSSQTIKKAYQKWLKDDYDDRTWKQVIDIKYTEHLKRLETHKKSFIANKIGYVILKENFSYEVQINGRMPLYVSFKNPSLKTRDKSLKKFIKGENFKLEKVKNRDDAFWIYTDVDLRRFS